ncbi:gamma-glutamylcyclotransferase [Halosimplex sp. J119]
MRAFVYGTLTDPERAGAVLNEFVYRGPAVLDGLQRVDGEYPTLAVTRRRSAIPLSPRTARVQVPSRCSDWCHTLFPLHLTRRER